MNQADHDQPGDSGTGLALGPSPARARDRPDSPIGLAQTQPSPQAPAQSPPETPDGDQAPRRHPVRAALRHPVPVHLVVLLSYLAVGVAVTWPHATYLLDRKLPATLDAGSYVWGFWWMAHSVQHLTSPWTTGYMAAPVGTMLGLHALMPLVGVVMLPITIWFGPSASYTALSVALPGLLAYAMYRVARLWLPSQIGAIAAGGFFGFSAILGWQTWVHLNLAAGALFLPLALEAAVRLRRRPGLGRALILGLVVGASLLVDQESAVLAGIVAAVALVPWLLSRPGKAGRRRDDEPSEQDDPFTLLDRPRPPRWSRTLRWLRRSRAARLWPVALAVLVAAVVASPQIFAIMHEAARNGTPPPDPSDYLAGIRLPDMFQASPRVRSLGLSIPHARDWSTYGDVLTGTALIGLILAWRRLNAWLLALLWLMAAALAVGSNLQIGKHIYTPDAQLWHGVRLSMVLPFTWFARIPGLSGFREPSRVAELGLVPAALLAGYAVNWLRYHFHLVPVALVIMALGLLEAGGSGPIAPVTMATAYPALDRPIAADHSGSTVLTIPFGVRGGVGVMGEAFSPMVQVLATANGHPTSDAYLSRIPPPTAAGILAKPFYRDLIASQTGYYNWSPGYLRVATASARSMHIGWVLLWEITHRIKLLLYDTGFRYDYRADGVSVWRPVADLPGSATAPPPVSSRRSHRHDRRHPPAPHDRLVRG
jgi:hypothetical protein